MTNKPDFEKLRREATPGPWFAARNAAYWEIKTARIAGREHSKIPFAVGDVCATNPDSPDSGEQKANARFIASIHAIDDARIAAEERVAKLEKQLAIAVDALIDIQGIPDFVFWRPAEKALAKIKEIDNEEWKGDDHG